MSNLKDIMKYSQKLKLLYVEDDLESREKTFLFLKKFFNVITIAEDGEKGFEIFQKSHFDLIITDINMPKLNGMEMIKKIRETNSDVLILIFSAYNEIDYFTDSIKSGVEGYLMKPINLDQFLGVLSKITEKLILKQELDNQIYLLKQFQEVMDSNSIVSKVDKKGMITYVNDNFCKISGYSKDEVIGNIYNFSKYHNLKKNIYNNIQNTIRTKKKTWNGIVKNISKSGDIYYVSSTVKPILDKNGHIIEYISLGHNVSTILSDKQHFLDKLDQNNLSIVILIQINQYKMLEKLYNSAIISKIEKQFYYETLSGFPSSYKFENLYYLDNGTFALITDYYKFEKKEILLKDYLEEFSKNIHNISLEVSSLEINIDTSISYAMGKYKLYDDLKSGIEEFVNKDRDILNSNDLSIKQCIEAKKNLSAIKMIKTALDNYNVISFFQPIVNNKTKEIEKYESLVRIIDEDGKILTPYNFLEISKKASYYNKITLRVLENSFRILNKINTQLSINLSTLDIEKVEMRKKIFEFLDKYKKDRKRLIFELLEDEEAKDFETIKKFIKKVKQLGVSIAIDDFGAGYSNYERLLEFQPDILKIDGSLVKDIETNAYSLSVVKTIVAFAKEQNIQTIAEFVENEQIFNILKELGVDYSQGYYLGKPEEIKMK